MLLSATPAPVHPALASSFAPTSLCSPRTQQGKTAALGLTTFREQHWGEEGEGAESLPCPAFCLQAATLGLGLGQAEPRAAQAWLQLDQVQRGTGEGGSPNSHTQPMGNSIG